ncbi:MAG: hypothetical protein LBE22_07685 [Azoarcus sp.]|jgi:hypothetical protein|nr:hypothetical protein [Azoarcus sp.]
MPLDADLLRLDDMLSSATHGQRGVLIAQAAQRHGVCNQTIHRWLTGMVGRGERRRRSDAGTLSLSREDAQRIALAIQHGISAAGKRRVDMTEAVRWLRDNNMIPSAERVDPDTGEITTLSISTIRRAMKAYMLDADALARPAPHQALASIHPNHVWQVDASVCVLFYLPGGGCHLVEIDDTDVYKNKPENARAIELFRVIRYVGTDHCSGVFRWRFYPHSESGRHTCEFLCWMMARKPGDPFHGRPMILMVDPGATASGTVKKFCRRMGITLLVNKAKNARAKGQVERAQNHIEKAFEAGLAHVQNRIRDFKELNELAEKVQLNLNGERTHSRHGMSRFDAWGRIMPSQLIETAPYERLLYLITEKDATPVVQGDLSVRFDGKRWDVRNVPETYVGERLPVCLSPFSATGAVAIREDGAGREVHIPLTEIAVNDFGFRVDAAIIGQEYKQPPQTITDRNKTELLKLGTGSDSAEEARRFAARRGHQPFGDQLNPFKRAEEHPYEPPLPRATTPMPDITPTIAPRTLTATRAAMRAREVLGEQWQPEMYEWITRRYRDGIDEAALDRLIGQWQSNGTQQTEEGST